MRAFSDAEACLEAIGASRRQQRPAAERLAPFFSGQFNLRVLSHSRWNRETVRAFSEARASRSAPAPPADSSPAAPAAASPATAAA